MAVSLWLFNFIEIAFVCFIIVQAIETTNPKKKSVEQAKPNSQVQHTSALAHLTEVIESKTL